MSTSLELTRSVHPGPCHLLTGEKLPREEELLIFQRLGACSLKLAVRVEMFVNV